MSEGRLDLARGSRQSPENESKVIHSFVTAQRSPAADAKALSSSRGEAKLDETGSGGPDCLGGRVGGKGSGWMTDTFWE